jgi:hypothetical protein
MGSFDGPEANDNADVRLKQVLTQIGTLMSQLEALLLHSTQDPVGAANDNRDENATMIKGPGGAQTKVSLEQMRVFMRRGAFALSKLKSATSVEKKLECIDFAKTFAKDIHLVFPFLPTSLGVADHEE